MGLNFEFSKIKKICGLLSSELTQNYATFHAKPSKEALAALINVLITDHSEAQLLVPILPRRRDDWRFASDQNKLFPAS